jgi:hypothetical protein
MVFLLFQMLNMNLGQAFFCLGGHNVDRHVGGLPNFYNHLSMTMSTCQRSPPSLLQQQHSVAGGTTLPIRMTGSRGAGEATTLSPSSSSSSSSMSSSSSPPQSSSRVPLKPILRWLVVFAFVGMGFLLTLFLPGSHGRLRTVTTTILRTVPSVPASSPTTAPASWDKPPSNMAGFVNPHNQTAAPTATPTSYITTTHNQYQTWMVIYIHFQRTEAETVLFLQTYEMFNNQNLYQKLLFVWDSQQNDSLDFVLPHIPPQMSNHFLYLDMATETTLKRDFEHQEHYTREKCFDRGSGYCGMLFYKTQLDLFVQVAAEKYNLQVPDIIAVGDGDIYWHTLPVHGNVMDLQGRLIFQTITCTSADALYSPAVKQLLHTKHYLNGGVTLPIPIWFDSFANMRDKIIDLHYQQQQKRARKKHKQKTTTHVKKRDWFEIYNQIPHPLCEFCLMATYLDLYESERYRFTKNPCSPTTAVATTNVFRDSSSSSSKEEINAPSIFVTMHDKKSLQRSQHTLVKGCCLTYGISKRESKGKCKFTVNDFTELAEFDPWNHVNGYTSPTLLLDHHEQVWQTLATLRSPGDNARGEAACRRYVAELPQNG